MVFGRVLRSCARISNLIKSGLAAWLPLSSLRDSRGTRAQRQSTFAGQRHVDLVFKRRTMETLG